MGGGGREVYTRSGATTRTSAKMRRSQSARTYQEEVLEASEDEHEQERTGQGLAKATSTRRRKKSGSKMKGRKTTPAGTDPSSNHHNYNNSTTAGSPMRGKIRPKSGRI